jgi:hypothetical protein
MLYIKIHYGLGNQLFQYALARSLSTRKELDYRLDTSFFATSVFQKHPRVYQLNQFNIQEKLATPEELRPFVQPSLLEKRWRSLELRLLPYHKQSFVSEKRLDFDENIFRVRDEAYLLGYWQDIRYFSDIEAPLREELTFRCPPKGRNKELLDRIVNTSSISLHIRRGDYLTDSFTIANVGRCDMDYYQRAVEEIAREITDPIIYVFSDDPDWVKENFRIPFQLVFVDNNPEEKAVEDLRLMSACRYHITANSSFSWWGAWLSAHPEKKVITPRIWRSKGPDMFLPPGWKSI